MNDLRNLGGVCTARIVAAPASGNQRERRDETVSVVRVRRALHHLIVFQRVPGQAGLAIPVLYLAEPNGDGTERLSPFFRLSDISRPIEPDRLLGCSSTPGDGNAVRLHDPAWTEP